MPKKLSSFLLVSTTDNTTIACNVAVELGLLPLLLIIGIALCLSFFSSRKKNIKAMLSLFFISSRMTDGNPHRHARFVHRSCTNGDAMKRNLRSFDLFATLDC